MCPTLKAIEKGLKNHSSWRYRKTHDRQQRCHKIIILTFRTRVLFSSYVYVYVCVLYVTSLLLYHFFAIYNIIRCVMESNFFVLSYVSYLPRPNLRSLGTSDAYHCLQFFINDNVFLLLLVPFGLSCI